MNLEELREKVETADDRDHMIRIIEEAGRLWRKDNPDMDFREAIEYLHEVTHPRVSEEIDKAARRGQLNRYYRPPQA